MKEFILRPFNNIENKPYHEKVNLLIRSNEFKNVEFRDGITTFTVMGCAFFEPLTIQNESEIDFPNIILAFFDCYIKEINIDDIVSKNISIYFGSSIVGGRIRDNNLQSVVFNNCLILSSFFLINLNSISISLTEENIFPIRWKKLFQRIQVKNFQNLIKQKQSYYIYDCKKIHFYTKEKKGNKSGVYRRPFEKSIDQKIGYYLSDEQKLLFDLNVSLKYASDNKDIETKIYDAYLTSLSITGSPNGKIAIDNTKIENWYLRDFTPKEEVNFYNISPLSKKEKVGKAEFHKCKLDNAWFDSINFKDYLIVSFYRSKLSKTVFTSCIFHNKSLSFEKFQTLENVHYPDVKPDDYYKNQYEILIQLKKSLEASGNFYEAQRAQASSNEVLKKVKGLSKSDKIILRLNSISNIHGLSIKRPLLLFLTTSVIFYILYLFSLNRIFNSNEVDYTLVGYYFSFIDITHRVDFLVDKSEFNFWSLSIDFVNKIIVGFLIYQFVAAFRKYGKN